MILDLPLSEAMRKYIVVLYKLSVGSASLHSSINETRQAPVMKYSIYCTNAFMIIIDRKIKSLLFAPLPDDMVNVVSYALNKYIHTMMQKHKL